MNMQDVLARLHNVKGHGDSYTAKCPAHDDQVNSLSIRRGEDGRTLLKCFAGCPFENVRDALGLKDADLAPPNGSGKIEVVARYDYTDEDGKVLYRVVRTNPKGFWQEQPDGTPSTKGVRRVLYQLPEVIAATERGEDIFIVEGEKDADNLTRLGLCATTNSGGGGQRWLNDYNDVLKKARRIIVLPDNDDTGRTHALEICAALPQACVLQLPDLSEHGDVSDWLAAGGTSEHLQRLVAQQLAVASKLHFRRLGDLMKEPDRPIEWLVDDLLATGGISCWIAKPKVGKSTGARNVAFAVARGEPFLGRQTCRGTVYYMALEEIPQAVTQHFRMLGATGDEPLYVHAEVAPDQAVEEMRRLVEREKPALLIIDPLLRCVRVKDANDYAAVTAALEPLVALARKTGTHIMFVHHARKSDGDSGDITLGSTAIFGSVDTFIGLRKGSQRTIFTTQRYGHDMEETVLQFDEATGRVSLGVPLAEAETAAMESRILCYLENAGGGVSRDRIRESVEGKTQRIEKALRELVTEGKVRREGAGKSNSPFLYYAMSGSQFPAPSPEPGTGVVSRQAQTALPEQEPVEPQPLLFDADTLGAPPPEGEPVDTGGREPGTTDDDGEVFL